MSPRIHAAEDSQVPDAVFDVLARHDFRVDATVFEKCKAYPSVKDNERYFYRLAWYLHFKYAAPLIGGVSAGRFSWWLLRLDQGAAERIPRGCPVGCGSGVPRTNRDGYVAIGLRPCLWVADYCTWAIQRKWERGDEALVPVVKDRIRSEFDVWRRGTALY